MTDSEQLRVEILNKGKSVIHASKTLKNSHITKQMEQFQTSLSVKLEPEHYMEISTNIKLFKDGIMMTEKKLNREFKINIIEYCNMSIEYYEGLMSGD